MRVRSYLLRFLLALLSCLSHAADCGADKAEYADLNQPLRVSYAGEQAYLSVREAQTDRLHAFAADRILSKLGSGIDSPSEIVAYVQCLQSLVPENAVATNLTNLPLAFFSRTHAPAIVVGYDTYRGWGAVPDDRYYFDAFSKEDGQWRLVDGWPTFTFLVKVGTARPIVTDVVLTLSYACVRFRCAHGPQTHREAALRARQSSQARTRTGY